MTALGAPDEPEALASLPAMAFDRYAARDTWDLHHAEKGKRSVVFDPRYVTDDLAASRLAAEDGVGVGVVQLPLYMVREQLHAGTLVAALPGWDPASGIIHAVFSSRRGQSPALRAFIALAAQAFENVDED
jgi:DNA-binding transcriptional LysR family regulator